MLRIDSDKCTDEHQTSGPHTKGLIQIKGKSRNQIQGEDPDAEDSGKEGLNPYSYFLSPATPATGVLTPIFSVREISLLFASRAGSGYHMKNNLDLQHWLQVYRLPSLLSEK